jgi:hypothetical protein
VRELQSHSDQENLDLYLASKPINMFDKKKTHTDLLGKTNRIVEGTTIKVILFHKLILD